VDVEGREEGKWGGEGYIENCESGRDKQFVEAVKLEEGATRNHVGK